VGVDILQLIADDKSLITYRPKLNQITGSVVATIILQQCLFRWKQKGKQPFYKFTKPCAHNFYVEGDSWCEELGTTEKQFTNALKSIAFKRGKSNNIIKKEDALILYYTDSNRLTWYTINEELLGKLLLGIYLEDDKRSITKKTTFGHLPVTIGAHILFPEKGPTGASIIHTREDNPHHPRPTKNVNTFSGGPPSPRCEGGALAEQIKAELAQVKRARLKYEADSGK